MGESQKDEQVEEDAKHESARPWSNSRTLLPGLVLIALGTIFLLSNLTGFRLDNWWALFILIPAVNNFSSGLEKYRQSGNFNRKVRGHFFSAFFFVLLSLAFFISLDFGLIWPAFLILAGLGILAGAF